MLTFKSVAGGLSWMSMSIKPNVRNKLNVIKYLNYGTSHCLTLVVKISTFTQMQNFIIFPWWKVEFKKVKEKILCLSFGDPAT